MKEVFFWRGRVRRTEGPHSHRGLVQIGERMRKRMPIHIETDELYMRIAEASVRADLPMSHILDCAINAALDKAA